MTARKCDREESDRTEGSLPVADLPKQKGGEVHIDYLPEAPRGNPDRRIHERLPIPAVPEGDDVPDPDPSPPVDI
jgi:hypothetical protein